MAWIRASLIVQLILAAYFQGVLWSSLGAWNDQSAGKTTQAPLKGFGSGFSEIGVADGAWARIWLRIKNIVPRYEDRIRHRGGSPGPRRQHPQVGP